jgi:acyl-CoA synthetase (AMP-forming)/AMP-acid ligase II/acyl carrier protein
LEEFYKTFAPYGFRWNTFCPGYGLAEATLKVTAARIGETPIFGAFEANSLSLHRIVETVESEPDAKILVGCGRTLLETKVAIVEPQSLKQCPSGSVGEIWVSGPSVTKGYWNRPEETQRTFQSYLADTGEGPFLRTGDLGFVKDSELFVTGRIKDLIIIRGTNHYPQDIELTAEQSHPSLRSDYCAAFAIEEKDQERLVIACEVERTYLKKLNTDEVIRAIRQAVSEAHELEVYMVLLLKTGSIPKTSSGKIQRQACRNQILNQQLEVVAQWQNPLVNEPSSLENPYGTSKNLQKKNLTKEQIQDWIVFWSAKHMGLDITQIDPFQPLSRYSLSSLQMMELSSELEALLGYSIDPDWLWDSSSIERLADQLYNSRNACLTIPAL